MNNISQSDPIPVPHDLPRTARFMLRVDEKLASLVPEARVPWLRRQLAVWVRQYERWALEIDSGHEPPGDATADDYLDTISALGRALREYEK